MFDADFRNFRIEQDDRGVLTVVLDVPERSVNVFDESVLSELEALVERLEGAADVKAVVFRSGKESGFLAGADVRKISSLTSAEQAAQVSEYGQRLFDRIERLPMPTVAVIHGPCLGGGLEFALACRHRIARDDASTRIGLPEVQLGILPAWGGTQRLPRQIGLVPALPMILQGQRVPASKAAKLGLVDLAAPPEEFDAQVARFIDRLAAEPASAPKAGPPHKSILARFANNTRLGRWLVFRAISGRIAREARHYPAVTEALQAVKLGTQRSRDEGLKYEREAIGRLLLTPVCHNLIQIFFSRERARNPATWTAAEAPAGAVEGNGDGQVENLPHVSGQVENLPHEGAIRIETVGVVGAGTMGAGIAQLAAFRGLPVVLRDVNDEIVSAGMDRIRKLFDEAVRKTGLRREEAAGLVERVRPTVDWEPLADADLVVEAVVEREDVKRQVFEELERRVRPEAVLATNTSSLSVERLAAATPRPGRVAGLHFFNPVHRMELVEVVRTGQTAPEAVEALVRFVRRLGKTPVVVNDSPGFLVNRVLFPYLAEAVRMVAEGLDVTVIDREAKRFGMPMGPLELLDQVGIDVAANVAGTLAGDNATDSAAQRLSAMVEKGWLGKKSGRGFYEYHNGRRGRPTGWEGPAVAAAPSQRSAAGEGGFPEIQQRLVHPMINEAARCLEENVVSEPWIVDLAMVLGTGFAPFRGGPLRLADELGLERVVSELKSLQERYGDRFAPAERLVRMGEAGEHFYQPREEPVSAAASK